MRKYKWRNPAVAGVLSFLDIKAISWDFKEVDIQDQLEILQLF
jgi:hypothetical protein